MILGLEYGKLQIPLKWNIYILMMKLNVHVWSNMFKYIFFLNSLYLHEFYLKKFFFKTYTTFGNSTESLLSEFKVRKQPIN